MNEIEIRGRLSKAEFNRLSKLLKQKAKLLDHYHRLSVDLSPGFDPVKKTWPQSSGTDIRLKKSDNKEKLTVKTGDFSDVDRQEVEIKLETGQFLNTLNFLEILGFKTGMVYTWQSWEFSYLGAEIKLSKYTDSYFTFEIEAQKVSNLDVVAKKLKLTPYTKKEYRQAIDWENQYIHQVYSKKLVQKLLKKLFPLNSK